MWSWKILKENNPTFYNCFQKKVYSLKEKYSGLSYGLTDFLKVIFGKVFF